MRLIIEFVLVFLQVTRFVLLIGTLLPLILPADNNLRIGITRIMDPLLRPFRKIIKPISGFDFSPLVLYFLLIGLETLISRSLLPMIVK